MRYQWLLICTLLSCSGSTAGQDHPCEVDIPVNIVTPELALVRHVPKDGFIAHHGDNALAIHSVDADIAPRRIVLVVENGKSVNSAARKIEASVLGGIVTNARAEDSFAFLTARGPRKELPFGIPRDMLLSSIRELSSPANGKDQGKSALEAVLEASGWLQPSQPGDSIILLTMGLEPGEMEYGKVTKTLTTSAIRLFGFQFGVLYLATYSSHLGPIASGPFPIVKIDPNRETIFDLGEETGGFLLEENTEGNPQLSYHLTDDRLQQLGYFAGQLYKGVVEYYRMRLGPAPEGFVVDLSDSVRQKVPKAHVLYPRRTLNCSPISRSSPSRLSSP